MYILERVPAVVKATPGLANQEPFKTVMSGDRAAMARLTDKELEIYAVATLTGMPVEQFQGEVKNWMTSARDPRWKKPYNEFTYLPMQAHGRSKVRPSCFHGVNPQRGGGRTGRGSRNS